MLDSVVTQEWGVVCTHDQVELGHKIDIMKLVLVEGRCDWRWKRLKMALGRAEVVLLALVAASSFHEKGRKYHCIRSLNFALTTLHNLTKLYQTNHEEVMLKREISSSDGRMVKLCQTLIECTPKGAINPQGVSRPQNLIWYNNSPSPGFWSEKDFDNGIKRGNWANFVTFQNKRAMATETCGHNSFGCLQIMSYVKIALWT